MFERNPIRDQVVYIKKGDVKMTYQRPTTKEHGCRKSSKPKGPTVFGIFLAYFSAEPQDTSADTIRSSLSSCADSGRVLDNPFLGGTDEHGFTA